MRHFFFILLAWGSLSASNAEAMGLFQIYREALVNDSIYASARASQTAGQEKSVQGRAGLLPTVVLSGQKSRTSEEDSSDFSSVGATLAAPAGKKYGLQLSYTLEIKQPLFRWANWQQYEQSKLAVVASDAQFAQAKLDLILRVAQTYFDVLDAQNVLSTLQAEKAAIVEQRSAAQRSFKLGTATITDTHEAQARYDLVSSQEIAAEADLALKRALLQQVSSKQIGQLPSLKDHVNLTPPEPSHETYWLNMTEAQNYEVIAAQIRLEIAKKAIVVSRAGHYPTVDLVATTQRNRTSGNLPSMFSSENINRTNSIGIQFSIPLFSGFIVSSQVNEAIALKEKAAFDLESARRSAVQMARSAIFGVQSGLAQVRALEAAEVSSLASLNANKRGYEVGVRINIDVLNAQHQLYLTQRNLAKTRYETIMHGLKLKAASSCLTEADLIQVTTLLDTSDT
ncbi:TolC family outer membrane protein [Undibacterium sp. RuRC25W]|uniref:TolC family outer membrane protein n=1 Tax=Undibacterium sp. RuRC25W TaxID=3413047 RepID=UPI003BF40F59